MGKHLSKYSSETDYNNNKDNHEKPHISLITSSPKKMKYEKKVLTNLITFKIIEIEYQAEEGMTWEEWVNSEYNTDGCYCADDLVWHNSGNNIYLSGPCRPKGIIINNTLYYYQSEGG